MNVGDFVRAGARRRPLGTALDDGEERLSYEELDLRVDERAARLAGLGAAPGGRLALLLPTTAAAVTLIHAGPRAGLPVAPLGVGLTTRELSGALEALDPVAVVCDGTTREAASEAAGGRRVLTVEELDGLEPAPEMPGTPDPDAERYVLWTSGTTGIPRGVRLTGRGLAASARASRRRLDLGPDDRWLASLSPAHVGGLALVTRAAFLGSTLVVRPDFDAAELARLAGEGEVSHASLVPIMLRRLLDLRGPERAPGGLRCLLVGGARTPEPLVRRALERGYPVALTYGMTETTSQVTTAPPDRVAGKPDAVGPPLDGVEVRIADDGGIRVRGATLAAGYLGGEPLDLDADGWLRTGDRGRLDEDGDLRVTGRRSERIVSGGVTVDAHEVEAALRSLAGVTDAAVVGVPDPEWGERVAALIVLEEEGDEGGRVPLSEGDVERTLEDRLRDGLRDRLSGPKRPRLVRVAAALPRTGSGKVDRARVRELLIRGRPSGSAAFPGRLP